MDDGEHFFSFVHRIDTSCSGLILAASTGKACHLFQWQLNTGTLVRDYVVLDQSWVTSELCGIVAPIFYKSCMSEVARLGQPSQTQLAILLHLAAAVGAPQITHIGGCDRAQCGSVRRNYSQ